MLASPTDEHVSVPVASPDITAHVASKSLSSSACDPQSGPTPLAGNTMYSCELVPSCVHPMRPNGMLVNVDVTVLVPVETSVEVWEEVTVVVPLEDTVDVSVDVCVVFSHVRPLPSTKRFKARFSV